MAFVINADNAQFGVRSAWWARQGLNLRPHPCEGCALPLSYAPAVRGLPGPRRRALKAPGLN